MADVGLRGFAARSLNSKIGAGGFSHASGAITKKVVEAVSGVAEKPYFAPLCDARLLSIRHYDWEPFSIVGDLLHVAGLIFCLCVCLRNPDSALPPVGVSLKTHILFFMVFTTRFSSVLLCDQPIALILAKVVVWTATLKIILILSIRGSGRDENDTLPIWLLVVPIAILTVVFGTYSSHDHGLMFEVMWIFSNYLEGFAMLPQYVYCYRDHGNQSRLALSYVLSMGAYRMVFGLNWILPLTLGEADLDVSTVSSGLLGVALFADYVAFKFGVQSPLSRYLINVDDDLRNAQDIVVDIARGSTLNFDRALSAPIGETVASEVVGKEVELHFVTGEMSSD